MMSHRTDMSGQDRAALNRDEARLESCDRPIVLEPASLELCLSSSSFWKMGRISRESIWFRFWFEMLWFAPPAKNQHFKHCIFSVFRFTDGAAMIFHDSSIFILSQYKSPYG